MSKLSYIDLTAVILVIIGGLNWGLIGFFNGYNLVAALFGAWPTVENIIYAVVGLAAVYAAFITPKLQK